MSRTIHTYVRFLVSGGTAALIAVGTVHILTTMYAVWYIGASIAGFLLATTVNFILQKYWTFNNASGGGMRVQSILFLAINMLNLFLNTALVFFFVAVGNMLPVLAQACSSALLALESYIVYRRIIFYPHASPNHTR